MNIREMRAELGDTQSEFADRYRIPFRTIQNWETGVRKPPEYIVRLLERQVKEDLVNRRTSALPKYDPKKVNLPRSYRLLKLGQTLHHRSISPDLAHQPQHLGVAYLSENDYLAILLGGTRLAYALLYLQHHRAGKIHHLPAHFLRNPVCLGRLSVGTDQQGPAVPLHRLEGVHRAQAFFPEPRKRSNAGWRRNRDDAAR